MDKKRVTAPIESVAADKGQSQNHSTNYIIHETNGRVNRAIFYYFSEMEITHLIIKVTVDFRKCKILPRVPKAARTTKFHIVRQALKNLSINVDM